MGTDAAACELTDASHLLNMLTRYDTTVQYVTQQ